MSSTPDDPNRRILLVDDSPAIHEDFRKVLTSGGSSELAAARAAFLGASAPTAPELPRFAIDSAHQGMEGLEMLRAARAAGKPYAMAFVDVRMPPGWDGIETIAHLWKEDPSLQVVICTAYSDYSWEKTFERLGRSDRLLILKKPFDPIEISQLAMALTEKWNVERRAERLIEDLRRKEQEARAYASSLETVNRALETSKAAAERSSQMKTDFLVQLSEEIAGTVSGLLGDVERMCASTASLVELDTIVLASRYLLSTLEEVSDIALIESGRLAVECVPFAPGAPLAEVAAELGAEARAKGLQLSLELAPDLPEAVVGDPARVRRILHGLVTNAVRYTERGFVRLSLAATPGTGWGDTELSYVVADSGPGMDRPQLGRLFEPFHPARAERGGAGLGLAHAQRLARHMGGDIRVESEPGIGSRFRLALRLGLPEPGPAHEASVLAR